MDISSESGDDAGIFGGSEGSEEKEGGIFGEEGDAFLGEGLEEAPISMDAMDDEMVSEGGIFGGECEGDCEEGIFGAEGGPAPASLRIRIEEWISSTKPLTMQGQAMVGHRTFL